MKLGEVWVPGQSSDVSYTGNDGASFFGMEYYRNKVKEFQNVLNELDYSAAVLLDTIQVLQYENFDAAYPLILDYEEFESMKGQFLAAAEAINLGAAGINAMGGRMPELSIPTGLAAPFVIPVAMVAAVGAAVALISWGNSWLEGVNERLHLAATAELITDPATRDRVLQDASKIRASAQRAKSTGIFDMANIAKWVAIGGAALLAVQFLQNQRVK